MCVCVIQQEAAAGWLFLALQLARFTFRSWKTAWTPLEIKILTIYLFNFGHGSLMSL